MKVKYNLLVFIKLYCFGLIFIHREKKFVVCPTKFFDSLSHSLSDPLWKYLQQTEPNPNCKSKGVFNGVSTI